MFELIEITSVGDVLLRSSNVSLTDLHTKLGPQSGIYVRF